MSEICGVVDKISSRNLQNGGKIYNINVSGEWYGFGKYPPKFGEGAEIEFDISWNGDFANVDHNSLNIISAGNQRSSGGNRGGNSGNRSGYSGGNNRSSGGGNGGGYGGGSRQGSQQYSGQRSSGASTGSQSGGLTKDQYWENKEKNDKLNNRAIRHQACRNSALTFIDLLIKSDSLALPAKKADRMDAMKALLDDITAKFAAETVEYATCTKAAPQSQPQRKQPEPEPEPDLPDDGDDTPPFDDDLPEGF